MRNEPTTAYDRLQAGVLAEIERFNRARSAEILSASGNPDEDTDPLTYVRSIADEWADCRTNDEQRTAFLNDLAGNLTLEDIRDIRRTAEAVSKVTPQLIREAAGRGTPVPSIAAALDVKESYVYRVIRDAK